MNIQKIQIVQELFRAVDGKSASGKGKIFAEGNSSLSGIALSETPGKNVFAESASLTEVYSPPLFPLGHTQGIYEVLAIDTSTDDTVDVAKAGVSGDNTANTEYVVARQQVVSDKDLMVKNNVAMVKEDINPGSVLDLEV